LEPNPNVFYELNRNIKLNKIKNIKTLKIAAWSKKAKLELFSPKNRFGYGGQVSTLLPKSMEKEGISYNTHFSVNTITLNDLLRNQDTIDLLLIDAENAEVEILNGSDEILNKTKAIIIEVRDNTERTVKDILNNYGFNIKELDISKNSKNIFGKKY
jgi:FkbM family methyltransferase